MAHPNSFKPQLLSCSHFSLNSTNPFHCLKHTQTHTSSFVIHYIQISSKLIPAQRFPFQKGRHLMVANSLFLIPPRGLSLSSQTVSTEWELPVKRINIYIPTGRSHSVGDESTLYRSCYIRLIVPGDINPHVFLNSPEYKHFNFWPSRETIPAQSLSSLNPGLSILTEADDVLHWGFHTTGHHFRRSALPITTFTHDPSVQNEILILIGIPATTRSSINTRVRSRPTGLTVPPEVAEVAVREKSFACLVHPVRLW